MKNPDLESVAKIKRPQSEKKRDKSGDRTAGCRSEKADPGSGSDEKCRSRAGRCVFDEEDGGIFMMKKIRREKDGTNSWDDIEFL